MENVLLQICTACFNTNCILNNVYSSCADMPEILNMLSSLIPEIDLQKTVSALNLCNKCCDEIRKFIRFKEFWARNLNILMKKMTERTILNDEDMALVISDLNNLKNNAESKECNSKFVKEETDSDDKLNCKILIDNTIIEDDDIEKLSENTSNSFNVTIKTEASEARSADDEKNMQDTDKEAFDNKRSEIPENPVAETNTKNVLYQNRASRKFFKRGSVSAKDSRDRNNKKHACTICGRTFRYLVNMKQHIQAHNSNRQPICKICGKTFTTFYYVSIHMRIHTGDKPHTCQVCGKKFAIASSITRHMRIHTKERPFACDVCGKAFRESSKVKVHMRTHDKEKPYVCEVCGKTFSRASSVTIHKRTHTKEKPYPCKVCEKTFSDLSGVTQHMRTHTKEKPYACEVCGKSFSSSSTVKLHSRTHSKEKPYICKICGKGFICSSSVKVHIRTHTKEKPYSCKQCGKTFSESSKIARHMRTHTRLHLEQNPPC